MDVREVLAQLVRVAPHQAVERYAEALGEELHALGGDVDEVGLGARGDLGEDLGEEVRPVGGLDRQQAQLDVGVQLPDTLAQSALRRRVEGGAERGDDQ